MNQSSSYFGLSNEEADRNTIRVQLLDRKPILSIIVPTYNTRPKLLNACIMSILHQCYDAIELIIVDDASSSHSVLDNAKSLCAGDLRVKYIQHTTNTGISGATNAGVLASTGEYILLVDHDDELMPTSCLTFAEHIVQNPETDAWYSDQYKCDDHGNVIDHFHKPDWSPIYMMGVMYVGHLLAIRASLAKELLFDKNFDGVQDYEFMLRLSETSDKIGHIPLSLYKWRATAGSLASGSDQKSGIDDLQRRAVQAHLKRLGRTWKVRSHPVIPHRLLIKPDTDTTEPKISIIIPSRNQGEMIGRCLDSIYAMTDYDNFEVIVIDNQTTDPVAKSAFARHPIKRLILDAPFNYSLANNMGVEASSGDILLFLNNDTEVVSSNWLREMVLFFEDTNVGAVGATLLFPDKTVQHAGIVLGARGTADHVMRNFSESWDGYGGSLVCAREVSGVTAACMMMKKDLFLKIGQFSMDFANHYQDVDLCLKIREQNLDIICTGFPRLIHYESATRKSDGYDLGDRAILIDRWYKEISTGERYYNKLLNEQKLDYSLK